MQIETNCRWIWLPHGEKISVEQKLFPVMQIKNDGYSRESRTQSPRFNKKITKNKNQDKHSDLLFIEIRWVGDFFAQIGSVPSKMIGKFRLKSSCTY